MGLRDELQDDIKEMFSSEFPDFVAPINIVKEAKDRDAYDSVNDEYPTVEQLQPVDAMFFSYGSKDIDGQRVKVNDQKVVIESKELPDSYVISSNDFLRLESGTEFTVVNAKPIVGGETDVVTWILQVREHAS